MYCDVHAFSVFRRKWNATSSWTAWMKRTKWSVTICVNLTYVLLPNPLQRCASPILDTVITEGRKHSIFEDIWAHVPWAFSNVKRMATALNRCSAAMVWWTVPRGRMKLDVQSTNVLVCTDAVTPRSVYLSSRCVTALLSAHSGMTSCTAICDVLQPVHAMDWRSCAQLPLTSSISQRCVILTPATVAWICSRSALTRRWCIWAWPGVLWTTWATSLCQTFAPWISATTTSMTWPSSNFSCSQIWGRWFWRVIPCLLLSQQQGMFPHWDW